MWRLRKMWAHPVARRHHCALDNIGGTLLTWTKVPLSSATAVAMKNRVNGHISCFCLNSSVGFVKKLQTHSWSISTNFSVGVSSFFALEYNASNSVLVSGCTTTLKPEIGFCKVLIKNMMKLVVKFASLEIVPCSWGRLNGTCLMSLRWERPINEKLYFNSSSTYDRLWDQIQRLVVTLSSSSLSEISE